MITEIGKIRIRWQVEPKQIRERLLNHYKHYLISNSKDADIRIKVKTTSFCLPSGISPIIRTRNWEYFESKDKKYLCFPRGDKGSIAEITDNFERIRFFTLDESGQLLLYLFPEILYSLILPKFNGILIHACGVKVGRRIFVFIAPPEGGKSTISKLALKKGLTLLNDDRIILREINKKFYAFGNPWHGEVEITSSDWGEVKELFFLRKARRNSLRKISKKRMFSEILTNSFYIKEDKSNFQKIIEVIADIVNNVEGYELGFKPNERVWDFLSKKVYD
jgi:hypothetical protein